MLTTLLGVMGFSKKGIILILIRILTTSQVVATQEVEDEAEPELKQEHNLKLELHHEVDQKRKRLPLIEYFDERIQHLYKD